jgi:predicted DNA-binding transcriptional regulator AlpA
LRQAQVAQRYGFHERSIDRWVAQAKLPQPTLFLGRWPLWDEAELDAHDLALANAVRSKHDEATSDHV